MRRKQLLAITVAVGMLLSAVAVAKQQTVILKDGRRLTGEVSKTDAGYEIKTKAGTVVIATRQVLRVEDFVTPADEFKQRLARTDPKDPEALYRLAAWAWEKKLLNESKDLTGKVLKLKPDHENAKLLQTLIEISQARPSDTSKTPKQTGTDVDRLDPSMFLTKEDIQRIRLAELRESDRVAVTYRKDALKRFVEKMKGKLMFDDPRGERRFRGWPKMRQVHYILGNTDPRDDAPLLDDILISSDPEVFKTLRSRIWPIVLSGCAKPSCHGGAKGAGKLKLFDMPITDDRVMYTNFYILQAWSREGRALINRSSPVNSMLLQAGLPADIAKQNLKHPKALRPPPFKSETDRNFVAVEKWIRSLKVLLAPGYRVSYKLPQPKKQKDAAPAPAPAPAPPK